jgi:hypothetical protein
MTLEKKSLRAHSTNPVSRNLQVPFLCFSFTASAAVGPSCNLLQENIYRNNEVSYITISNGTPRFRDRCYDFENIFAKKCGEKMAFCKNFTITLVLEENANFFGQKLAKIAENFDHNIDPRTRRFKIANL